MSVDGATAALVACRGPSQGLRQPDLGGGDDAAPGQAGDDACAAAPPPAPDNEEVDALRVS